MTGQVGQTSDTRGWFASRIARLSTGAKMLLILSLFLFPLGFLALLASLESIRQDSAAEVAEAQARVEIKAQRINSALSRSSITIRAASAAIALTPRGSGICTNTLQRLSRSEATTGRYALFAGGTDLRCATPGFTPPERLKGIRGRRSFVELSEDGQALRFALFDDEGGLAGIGELSRETLSRISYIPGTTGNFDLELTDGDRRMVLRDGFEDGPLVQTIRADSSVASERLRLNLELAAVPIGPIELLIMLLPVLMWIAAALIGWLIVHWLLLKPLVRMQRAVSAYQPGDRQIDMPTVATPAREIRELGEAFYQVTQTVARHEADLEAAVERQTKLVREVHHRVKNNLQVVASLLNLHARGSPNEDVAAAYASIQRRVDALAVVHRNHYAELEENRGVALRSLISELGANLRATAPASAAGMAIRIDIEPFYATQDVAVSVAFLITEIVEFAMLCDARPVTITLTDKEPRLARLAIQSDSLKADVPCDEALADRFERIITGLSRQLRSTPDRDKDAGRFALDIAVVDRDD